MKKTKPSFSLKDQLFNKEKVEYLSGLIKNVYPDFSYKEFEKEILDKFVELELKQRISHISDMLKKYIWDKNSFEETVNILIKSLPKVIENGKMDNNFWDFIFCPYSLFVAENWCNKKYLKFSFNALERITCNFSVEDSIRYFFNKFEDETLNQMLEWSKSENYHCRRLSSEWSRPKLPWCQKINLDYKKTIEILDNLYFDESRYVTRSVANHLNDISKNDADLVIGILEKWKKFNKWNDLNYIISHSTRSLVKAWDKKTLEFLWYSPNPKVEINNFELNRREVKIWKNLEFSFDINFKKPENLIIDYKIYFQDKAWKLLPKVFKIKKINSLLIGDFNPLKKSVVQITKKHKLKIMSTKALYYWEHFVEIIINGQSFWKKSFELVK